MKKEDKERLVAELTERLRTTETLLVADYRGLTMPQIDELRTKLLEHGARFAVVKNTLTRRAAELAGTDTLLALLEGRPVEPGEIESLAKLPPLDILRSQVLGAVIGPLTAIVGLFTAPLQDLYGLLDARIEQLGPDIPEAVSGSEPQAQEAPSAVEETPSGEASGSEPQSETRPAETPAEETTTETQEEEQ